MPLFRSLCLVVLGVVYAAPALAESFAVPATEPRRSSRVQRISPDEMFEICGFERQDQPFFLDSEYRHGIADYNQRLLQLDPNTPEAQRLEGLRDGLQECRENDLNKRYAQRAMRSCKALVEAHRAASGRAEMILDGGYTPKGEVLAWGERFRAPLEKCLKSLKCRVDNKRDEEEVLSVYRQIVDEMQGWLLDVKGVERMQICGSTVRDVRNWCEVKDRPDADNIIKVRDDCKTPHELMLTIKLLQNIRIRTFPQPNAGGTIGGAP